MRTDRSTGFRPGSGVRRMAITVVVAFTVLGCGDPWALRTEIDGMVRLERFGGSLAKLYGTSGDDEFSDAFTVDDELVVLGSTVLAGRPTALVVSLSADGSISDQTVYASARPSGFTTARWRGDLDAIYGTQRWIVGGWYEGTSSPNGMVARLDTDSGEVIWIGAVGGEPAYDTVVDLAVDGNAATHVLGTSTAIEPAGSPLYAKFSSDGNRLRHVAYRTNLQASADVVAEANGMVFTESGDLLVVGTMHNGPGGIVPPDVSYMDVMMFRIDPDTGAVVDGSAKAYGLLGASTERGWAVEKLSNPERYAVVGSTDWVADIGVAWLLLLFDSSFSLEAAYAIKANNNVDGEARAIINLPDTNYWGRPGLLAVTGDNFELVIIDPNQEDPGNLISFATRRGPDASILDGRATAVAPNQDTFDGLFVIGTNTTGDTEGAVLWAVPDDLSSEPEMIATTPESPAVIGDVTEYIVETAISVLSNAVPDAVQASLPAAYFSLSEATLEITAP